MMIPAAPARLALLLVLASCSSDAGREHSSRAIVGPDARYASVAQALRAFIEHEMRDKSIPALSIALVDDQSTVWAAGFGTENPATGRPADAETVYRVGSVSKLFTDLGVMQLVERAEVELDAPVAQFVGDFAPRNTSGRPITLRQLMSHYSGLVREPPVGHYFDDSHPTLAATVASLNRTALVYPPGTRRKYSNAAIAVVGYLLQQHSGERFEDYLARTVLAPLGMQASAFEATPALAARLAAAQMWTRHGRTFPAPTFALGMAPAGSMYSTMPDLARFMSALFAGGAGRGGVVVQPATLASMWRPQFAPDTAQVGSGIGFAIGRLEGHRAVSHGGAIYGFATQLTALPDEKLGVAVSAARDGMNALTERIADEALRLMLAARDGRALPALDTTRALSPAEAAPFGGRFARGDTLVEVVVRDSVVTLRSGAIDHWLTMKGWRGDTLLADDGLAFGPRAWRTGDTLFVDGTPYVRPPGETGLPPAPPRAWEGLVGEYGWDHNVLYILEKAGRLVALIEWFFEYPLVQLTNDTYAFPEGGLYAGERLVFTRGADGRATAVEAAGVRFGRRTWVGEDGGVFRITPVRPVDELRAHALAATPPVEEGSFRDSDLVELVTLDPTIRLDVRYATDRNFLSAPVYTQARAFLQRPAAEALARAHRALAAQGYGLLVHDGYRPWYVTKMFWDGTPEAHHHFVADPSRGSRHNRGCAVDLTMYDRRTGVPVVMTGGYDEFSDRSYPEYPGGTSRQRALREVLRAAMEREGFAVYETEWWHFDYEDWRHYRIGNQRFEDLGR